MKHSEKTKWCAAFICVACLLNDSPALRLAGQSVAKVANTARKYDDPIPNPLTPPDPCDNATVKRW